MTTTFTILQLENSLYAHSQALIDEFNHLLIQHEQRLFDFLPNTAINSKIDFFSSVFNYWVQLINSDEIRPPRIDKLIFHTFSFDMHKMLQLHPLTAEFLSDNPSNEQRFVYCYFFTYKFLYLMHAHMPEQLLQQFLQMKDSVTYFASNDQDLQHAFMQELYVFRKNFALDLQHNMKLQTDVYKIIAENMRLTKQYFTSQISST